MEGYDGGIRLEESLDRDMVQLKLTGPTAFIVAGAPSYLAARGTPQRPRDLLWHDCIGYRSETTGLPRGGAGAVPLLPGALGLPRVPRLHRGVPGGAPAEEAPDADGAHHLLRLARSMENRYFTSLSSVRS